MNKDLISTDEAPKNHGWSGSKTPIDIRDLWQTPKELYFTLNAEFNFICDVAASDANYLHECYLTAEYDSVKNGWTHLMRGYVFCNPPYSDITPWVKNANEAALAGVGTVMLLPADTSVNWFVEATKTVSEVRFITGGRISFIRADTKKKVSGNRKGSMILIWNPYRIGTCFISFIERDWLMLNEKEAA